MKLQENPLQGITVATRLEIDTAGCGKLPLLTVCRCDLGTKHDWHNQSVTGDGKTSTGTWHCSGGRRHVCEGELVRTERHDSGKNIRKFFGNSRGRLMSRHCNLLVRGAAGRKQADSMCLSAFRGELCVTIQNIRTLRCLETSRRHQKDCCYRTHAVAKTSKYVTLI